MRIRLALTLSIGRRHSEAEIPPHDVIEGGAYVERAPTGFVGFGPDHEQEEDRR